MHAEDDIELLFKKMEEKFSGADEGAQRMFKMLVSVALLYRDQLVKRHEPPLTVGETQEALDSFMSAIKLQTFPEVTKPRIKDLVILWLEELRRITKH